MKQALGNTLSRIAEAQGYHEQALEFGQRAWRIRGRLADFIYWDAGNGWCDIIQIISKKGYEERLQQLLDEIEANEDV
jgi:hypothetical protein